MDSTGPNQPTGMQPLSASEQSAVLAAVFAYSADATVFVDGDFVVRAANQAFARHFGTTLDAVLARRAAEVMPDWERSALPICHAVRQSGTPAVIPLLRDDGAGQHEMRVAPVGSTDNPLGYLVTIRALRDDDSQIREHAERLQAVQAVTDAALSSLAPDALLRELLGRIRTALRADTAAVLLLDDKEASLIVRASSGIEGDASQKVTIPLGRGVAGRIAATRAPLVVDDLSGVEIFSDVLRDKVSSLAGVPLIAARRLIGVLQVGTTQPRHFSGDDVHLLQLVAERAALAIENARLYQQAHLDRARWQATIESMLDPVTVADAEGRAVYMNRAYSELIGRIIKVGLPLSEHASYYALYRPDGSAIRPEELPLQRAALMGEEVRNMEIIQRSSGGEEFIALWNAAPMRDADGTLVGAVAVGHPVTEQRRAEAERERLLSEHERQRDLLERLVQGAPAAIAILHGPEHRFTLANAEYRQLARTRGEVIGRTVADVWPEIAGVLVPLLDHVYNTGEPYHAVDMPFAIEREGQRQDGYFSFNYVALQDREGRPEGVIAFVEETTGQFVVRQRTDALASVAVEINSGRDLFDVLRGTLERTAELLRADDASLMLFEFEGDAPRGARDVMSEDPLGRVADIERWPNDLRAVQTKRAVYFTAAEARDREVQWFQQHGIQSSIAAPLVGVERSFGLLVVNFHRPIEPPPAGDIGFVQAIADQCALAIERERANAEREQLLVKLENTNRRLTAATDRFRDLARQYKQQADQLNALLENLGEAVSIAEPGGRVILRNQAARELTGMLDDQVEETLREGIGPLLRLDGAPMPAEEWPLMRAVRGERFTAQEVIYVRADGTRRWLLTSGSAIHDADGRVALGIVVYQDVTRLRELEQARVEYVRAISHDLRNPLTTVLGQGQLIVKRAENPALVRRSADRVITAARRMNAMVQDLVDSARLEAGQVKMVLQPVDLRHFVFDLVERTESGSDEDAGRIRVEADDALPTIWADPNHLDRIFGNLLSNALKYSEPGTPVTVRLEARENTVRVAIVDRGPGIAPDELQRLFQRYYRGTAGQLREGLGLGLAITKGLVEAHGGNIWVESKPGQGSTFQFSLPVERAG